MEHIVNFKEQYMRYLFPRGLQITVLDGSPTEQQLQYLKDAIDLRIKYAILKAYVENIRDDITDEYLKWKKDRKTMKFKALPVNDIYKKIHNILVENAFGSYPLSELPQLMDYIEQMTGVERYSIDFATVHEREAFLDNLGQKSKLNTSEEKRINKHILERYDLGYGGGVFFDINSQGFIELEHPAVLTQEDKDRICCIEQFFTELREIATRTAQYNNKFNSSKLIRQLDLYSRKVEELLYAIRNL